MGELGRVPREFPDLGRGDFRLPAVRVRHGKGEVVTRFRFKDHEVVEGKPGLEGLPSTTGSKIDASTLIIHLADEVAQLDAYLSYTIFSASPAIARSIRLLNRGNENVVVEQASVSLDMPSMHYDMIHLSGDWASEASLVRRKVQLGVQAIHSSTGYSSHLHNPFIGLVGPDTNERSGEAYGFSLIYSGSFAGQVERSSHGSTRVMLGLNPLHLSWSLAPGQSFTTPEVLAVYSPDGLGGMSRAFHRLYRTHLSRSKFTLKTRPALLNNWEATYFDFDANMLYDIAKESAGLGVKLFVMDDGWFGDRHPRTSDAAGLGDWVVNPKRFPNGLADLVKRVNGLRPSGPEGMRFGIWVEPEMVNPASELYESHPDWVLHAAAYDPPSTQRNQLVLDLSLKAVQDYIIDAMTALLKSANIGYVKWDNNRGMHEMSTPSKAHSYMLGLYRVMDTLITAFPTVLWEGCASGGGRFDPGVLHYWCQSWTSDNTDALDRLFIQFGTSLVYPPSSMAGHISAVPSHQTGRITPIEFRAHVAMMCGSFGFELDPRAFTADEKMVIPALIDLSERINPLIITGDLYRLSRPDESNWPAAMYLSEDGETAVVLAFQMEDRMHEVAPRLRLQGLDKGRKYTVTVAGAGGGEGREEDGETLMGDGLRLGWKGDYQSRVIWVKAV